MTKKSYYLKVLAALVTLAALTALTMTVAVGPAEAAKTAKKAKKAVFNLGKVNPVTAISTLTGNLNSSILRIDNNGAGVGATALDLQVEQGKSPMTVNSDGKVDNLNADKLDGKDFSTFGAKKVIDTVGALPKENTYISKGGTLIISASGSGFRSPGNTKLEGNIGMFVLVDGFLWGKATVFTNERDSHKAFVSDYTVVTGLPAGSHTIRLQGMDGPACNTTDETRTTFCTTTNEEDNYKVTVMEVPA